MRTKQTARRAGMMRMTTSPNETSIANPDLTAEEQAKLDKLEQGPMQAELKYLDKKWTDVGQTYFAETVEKKHEDAAKQNNWWSQFALCLVRLMMDPWNPIVHSVELQVNSSHLKDLLKTTIPNYPGMSFDTKNVTIQMPYRCLFHYRHELDAAGVATAAGPDEENSEAAQHHELLMQFIDDQFKDAINDTENLLEQGLISFEYLWAIFIPGKVVYSVVEGQPRAFTLKSTSTTREGLFMLQTEYVDYDGNEMGLRDKNLTICPFAGSTKVNSLSAYPMEWHDNPDSVKQTLIKRGRRWERLAGMHFRSYSGLALEVLTPGTLHYEGKVVVDTKTSHRLNANQAWKQRAFDGSKKEQQSATTVDAYGNIIQPQQHLDDGAMYTDDDLYLDERDGAYRVVNKDARVAKPATVDVKPLTDEQCLLASATVRGFAFGDKRWLDFFVDQLSPIEWNTDCFDQLVLPPAQKDLVKALVAMHVGRNSNGDGSSGGSSGGSSSVGGGGINFDDIVKGKGKGLIFVLHGPPGTGKTLTAETVAEYSQRPLYAVSSDDLSTNSEHVDERLTRILDMASTWKAVLLIDEADIFLERRSLHDLNRNLLVTTFLRVLEYYQGILFLTSNRVSTFDEAFKSRIHVPLKYNDLTPAARKVIWKNFLAKTGGEEDGGAGALIRDEKVLDRLAGTDINGRQIKNVVRTASSLAKFHGQPLDEAKLRQVIGIHEEFDQEINFA